MDMLVRWRVILFLALMGSFSFSGESNKADILVLIDGSGSVGYHDFQIALDFVKKLADESDVGPSETQFALFVFTTQILPQFNWKQFFSRDELKNAISSTNFPGGGENLSRAIHYAKGMFLNASIGRRPDAIGKAVLITDGQFYVQSSINETEQLKDLCVTVYTVGIGSIWNENDLKNLASSSSHYFRVEDESAPKIISRPTTSSACSDECASNPCLNGTCFNALNKTVCSCQSGFTGTLCDQNINDCHSGACLNGATCIDGINSFSCQCAPGFTGIDCGIDVNDCLGPPCENNGTCQDLVNGFLCHCPDGYYGDYCETSICQPSVADIIFVLDSSVSQTKEDFRKQLDFINHFIDHIVIGEENFQVGIVTYSFEAVTEIQLGKLNNSTDLKEAVRNIKYRPGATFTDKGLIEAKKVFNNAQNLRPYHKIAKRFAFVITDGLSTNRLATAEAAASLKKSVNKVLAIGIGKEVSHLELLSIASAENIDTGRKYVYSVQNFNALYTIVKELVHITCQECYWKTSSDVLFLLDMSITISVSDFQTALNAITYLVHRTTQMENENNTVRIGLVTYGMGIQVQKKLNDSNSKQMFLSSLQKLVLRGHCPVEKSSCDNAQLSDAIRYASKNIFDQSENSTTEKREMIVILSNGKQMLTDETLTVLEKLRTSGKYVYVIALGPDADIKTLQRIVGDPALVFSVYDELSQQSINALTTEFFFSSCNLTNDFVNN